MHSGTELAGWLRYWAQAVYKTPPANVDELQERITNEITALRRTRMDRRAMRDMRTRAIKCIKLEARSTRSRKKLMLSHLDYNHEQK